MEAMDNELHELEFHFKDLQKALQEQGMTSYVEQTGGGTATVTVHNEDTHERILVGPGQYNYMNPQFSIFGTYELSIGEDPYGLDDEYKPVEPKDTMVEEGASLTEIAELVKRIYSTVNA